MPGSIRAFERVDGCTNRVGAAGRNTGKLLCCIGGWNGIFYITIVRTAIKSIAKWIVFACARSGRNPQGTIIYLTIKV